MPKVDISLMTHDETVVLLSECIQVLNFDDVFNTLMMAWDLPDKEEAFARLGEELPDESMEDC